MYNQHNKNSMEEISSLMEQCSFLAVMNFNALSANDLNSIRSKLRPLFVKAKVFKNNLMEKSLEQHSELDLSLNSLYVFHDGDIVDIAKATVDLAKSYEGLSVVGLFDLKCHVQHSVKEAEVFASLPSKAVVYKQLLDSISRPLYLASHILISPLSIVCNQLKSLQQLQDK